jgi:hypothetical protein
MHTYRYRIAINDDKRFAIYNSLKIPPPSSLF